VHRIEPGPLLSAAQLYFETGPRPCRCRLAWPTRSLALHVRTWVLFRPRADADRQRCVPTAPATALTCATYLPASTRSACNHRPMCSASSQPSSSQRRGKASLALLFPQQTPNAHPFRSASHRAPLLQAPKH
jgi:hypothetical protein